MIDIAGHSINPAFIVSAEVQTSHYMNGSSHWLVVRLAGGREIRKEHGYGFNAFADLERIREATA